MEDLTIDISLDDKSASIVRYFCKNNDHLEYQNVLYAPYAYEMSYDCSQGPSSSSILSASDGMEVMEESMLVKLKNRYLNDASACITPPQPQIKTPQDQSLWITALDSRPQDTVVEGMKCTHLRNNNDNDDPQQHHDTCCIVVQGNMSFSTNLDLDSDQTTVLSAAREALIASNRTAGYSIYYLGIEIHPTTNAESPGNVDNAKHNSSDDNIDQNDGTIPDKPDMDTENGNDDSPNSTFSLFGGCIVTFWVICLCVVVGFVYRKQQKQNEKRAQVPRVAKVEGYDARKSWRYTVAKASRTVVEFEDDNDDNEKGINVEKCEVPEIAFERWIEPRMIPSIQKVTQVLGHEDPAKMLSIQAISPEPFQTSTYPSPDMEHVQSTLSSPHPQQSDIRQLDYPWQHQCDSGRHSCDLLQPRQLDPYELHFFPNVGGIAIVSPCADHSTGDSSTAGRGEQDNWGQTDETKGIEENQVSLAS